MSYPQVFKWGDEFYMVPETVAAYEVRLYKALEFPFKWVFVKTLMKGNLLRFVHCQAQRQVVDLLH